MDVAEFSRIVFGRGGCIVHAVSGTTDGNAEKTGRKPGLWRRLVVEPILGQLKQGISPDKLGWSIAAGVTVGIFPVWGTRAWICLLVGWLLKLNQPVLHGFKSLFYPVQVILMIPFIQMGQMIYGEPRLGLSAEVLKREFEQGAWDFAREFGWIILRASTAWLLVAPLLLIGLKWIVTPILRKAGVKGGEQKEAAC